MTGRLLRAAWAGVDRQGRLPGGEPFAPGYRLPYGTVPGPGVLARAGTSDAWWWTPRTDAAGAADTALHASVDSSVGLVAMVAPRVPAVMVGAAVTAGHALRARRPEDVAVIVTPTPPYVPDGCLRVPHPLDPAHHGGEDLIWELTTQRRAERWLGGPVPDAAFRALVESRLPRLLALCADVRAGRELEPAGRPALWEFASDAAEVTISDVYRHPARFTPALLAAAQPQPRTGEGR